MMLAYRIVSGEGCQNLEYNVNAAIRDGWQISGGAFIWPQHEMLYQAMVREHDSTFVDIDRRDATWALAITDALSSDGREFKVPMRPDANLFRALFEEIRYRGAE